jgi:hypothetical protein
MRQRTRGWIMPEADILTLLRLIDERVSSPKIEVRHRDTLIRLRDMLEDDLRTYWSDELPTEPQPQSGKRPKGSLAMGPSSLHCHESDGWSMARTLAPIAVPFGFRTFISAFSLAFSA